ncbi:MAG: hypothetical protein FWE48_07625 [Coriobacteriia bacterium]|nr:hypothetical protein [Coriobacteriia bacterium]MCL2870188.1 hypothetical protein [Coriobacteriia bacterium]
MSTAKTNEQLFRRIFIVVLLAMVVTVMLGLGPVWLSAEATRASQHSQLLKDEITDTLAISENLEMQRATITNDFRLNPGDLEAMGLVRSEGERSFIELNPAAGLGSSLSMVGGSTIGSDSVADLAVLAEDTNLGTQIAAEQSSAQNINLGQVTGNALDTVAQLTAGEAATLLLGDVGLAGMR